VAEGRLGESSAGPVALDQDPPMNNANHSAHPDPAAVRDFALGRLRSTAMHQVERHIQVCDICLRAALETPDDRLVSLLRHQATGAANRIRDEEELP
jgi:hypothetical protein